MDKRGEGLKGSVFLTIHNDSEGNPWSVLLIEELQKCERVTFVVSSLAEGMETMKRVERSVMVPVFDLHFGINRWSPCLNTACGIPDWARLFGDQCVAIGKNCVGSSNIIKHSADQIGKMFFQSKYDGRLPWGPMAKVRPDKKKRRAWRTSVSQWPLSFRRK